MSFGRKDSTCPRCLDLLNGAEVRTWTISNRKQAEAKRIEEIRTHDCKKSGCCSVCVRFDW